MSVLLCVDWGETLGLLWVLICQLEEGRVCPCETETVGSETKRADTGR